MPSLSHPDALARLTAAPVARLATAAPDGRPHLVPITFAVSGGSVFTAVDHKPKRTRDLRRLANLRANPHASVLADHYEDDWDRLWWVRADGRARVLTDPAAMAAPLDLLAARYPRYRDRRPDGPVIELVIDRLTGWTASS
ncbi:TIGR03668 family PPOX class F420-dependent oxidoreductase [Actinomadura logoneensis]|uniref:TIGR03668 family PPOX class F420-dependent oxidoreductase n=1 Tax=Actinomadura logoneensis TaxID=2293572 RepID=A0A372JLP5_9ACTN|nr:TIGR03668 family PPOX class F420-dependent oxidoreductase [Actinomadura logoneensis]RFU40736.1 TIGR03668 family PPOX class F420-dependent oxidoreductase [Actinomadura logoneensis]